MRHLKAQLPPQSAESQLRWRILCYHQIDAEDRDNFKAQAAALARRFTLCSFSDGLMRALKCSSGQLLSLTFDDGDRTTFDVALPVLNGLGIQACLYVSTDYIERGATYRNEPPRLAMTWRQIQEWASLGHEVGSHTHTHAPLPYCSAGRLRRELRDSKAILEDKLQRPVVHFSYPWGQHGAAARDAVLEAGYESAATIERGSMSWTHDALCLRRDVTEPYWSTMRVRSVLRLSDLSWLYQLRRLRRIPKGYWNRHPEIKWNEAELSNQGISG